MKRAINMHMYQSHPQSERLLLHFCLLSFFSFFGQEWMGQGDGWNELEYGTGDSVEVVIINNAGSFLPETVNEEY